MSRDIYHDQLDAPMYRAVVHREGSISPTRVKGPYLTRAAAANIGSRVANRANRYINPDLLRYTYRVEACPAQWKPVPCPHCGQVAG